MFAVLTAFLLGHRQKGRRQGLLPGETSVLILKSRHSALFKVMGLKLWLAPESPPPPTLPSESFVETHIAISVSLGRD